MNVNDHASSESPSTTYNEENRKIEKSTNKSMMTASIIVSGLTKFQKRQGWVGATTSVVDTESISLYQRIVAYWIGSCTQTHKHVIKWKII